MNQKKCPKCGELNPPEAVMCWACYTPLSGDGGGGASAAPRPAVANEDRERKAFAPWQIGLVVLVLLGALGFGAKTFLSGTSTDEDSNQPINAPKAPRNDGGGGNSGVVAPPVVSSGGGGGGGTQPQQIVPQPSGYSTVSAANPKYNWGTMAIVPTDPNTTPEQAGQMAASVRQKMMANKKWAVLHIYVFKDRQTGQTFKKYQAGRKGAPLSNSDYQALGNIWPNTLIRYEYNQGQETILTPSQNPSNWWNGKSGYSKAVR